MAGSLYRKETPEDSQNAEIDPEFAALQLADDTDDSLLLAMEVEGERPIGRAAAKENKKRKWDRIGMEASVKKMVDNSEVIAIEIRRKNETLERAVDLEVMRKDTSMMEPEQREFYAMQRKAILAKWRKNETGEEL